MASPVTYDAVAPLAPGCPWAGLNHALGTPNLKWCEATQCAWITEPANTWSNLAYFAVALLLFAWARRDPSPAVRRLPALVAVMGACSFAFHASSTYLFQIFDFVGMFLFLFVPLVLNLVRLGWLRADLGRLAYAALVILATAGVLAGRSLRLPYQGLIAIIALLIIGTELAMPRRERPASRASFWSSVLLLLAAQTSSLLDLTRLWCDPDDHVLQGHAVWHVLSAAAIVSLYRYYAGLRLPAALAGEAAA